MTTMDLPEQERDDPADRGRREGTSRPRCLRVALVVDPVTVRTKGGAHAPGLARQLLDRGHVVRGFGSAPGVVPRSGDLSRPEEEPDDGQGADRVGLGHFKPDVIVAYDAQSPASWLGARVARRQDAALVLVEGGIPPSAVRLHERFLHSLGERLWGRYVRDSCAAVVALDPVARATALEVGFPDERIHVLPEGVDTARFRPGLSSALFAQRRIRGRVCLHAGPLEQARGVEVLVRAFAATVGQREDWSLVFAGDGSAGGRVRVLADRLGIGARVHRVGRARPEELPGLMGGSTLLTVPALDESARGRQIARAMACGLPAIASGTERLRFYVEDGETGLLATPGDVAHWTAALARAAGSPEVRRRWGQRSLALAAERYAWPVVASRFEALLLRACEQRRAG